VWRTRSVALWTTKGESSYWMDRFWAGSMQERGAGSPEAVSGVPALEDHCGAVGGGWRSARVGLRAEMGPLRKSLSVRLEEGVHARLRRRSHRGGVPTSALVRALVHRWLDEQDEAGEARRPGRRVQNERGSRGSSVRKEVDDLARRIQRRKPIATRGDHHPIR